MGRTRASLAFVAVVAVTLFRPVPPLLDLAAQPAEFADPPAPSPLSCLPQFGRPELLLTHHGEGHPEHLFVEDFTQDGHPDILAMLNEWAGAADLRPIVLVNDRSGGFSEATGHVFIGQPPWLSVPREVLIADFNGDTHPDLFVADHGYDYPPFPGYQNSLILSASGGKLVDATGNLPQQLDFTHCASSADIDGDSDLDLFVGNIWGQSGIGPQLWLNDGSGHFAIGGQLPAEHADLSEHGYTTCLLADVTGDAAPDLILGDSGEFHDRTGGLSHILVNDGQGHFSELSGALPPKLWFPTDLALDIQATDLNGDDDSDLLLLYTRGDGPHDYTGQYIQMLVNNGDGTFRDETGTRLPQSVNTDPYVPFLELLDLDYDGDMDIAPVGLFDGGAPPYYLNDGQGRFAAWEPPLDFWPYTFAPLGDSGRRDILFAFDGGGDLPDRYLMLRDQGCPLVYLPLTLNRRSEPGPTPELEVDGRLEIIPYWGNISGWGWSPEDEIGLELRTSTDRLRCTITAKASSWGGFDTGFRYYCPLRDGDWFAVTLPGGTQDAFELRRPQAVADPTDNTIVGSGVPHKRIEALVEYPPESYHHLETVSSADGSFSFNFTPLVDWENGAYITVQQWVSSYAAVTIRDDTPELVVVGP